MIEDRLGSLSRKLREKLGSVKSSRLYSLRVRRELKRVAETFAGPDKPVLIHTYGKVGSTAVHTAISRLSGFGSFQTHVISEHGVRAGRRIHQQHGRDPIHLRCGEALRLALESHPDKRVRIITLVRDPVARAVSDLFENASMLVPERDIREMPLDEVVEVAAGHVSMSLDYTERWFDLELSGLLGFDVFARDFDPKEGFAIIREGRFELLIGKLEDLSNKGAHFLGPFLGLGRDLPVPHSRVRSITAEGVRYAEVRKSLRLPSEVLERVYGSRFCRHFYAPSELEAFRRLWSRD